MYVLLSNSQAGIGRIFSQPHTTQTFSQLCIRVDGTQYSTFDVEPDGDGAHVRVVGLADVDAGVLVAHLRYVEAPHAVLVAHLQWITTIPSVVTKLFVGEYSAYRIMNQPRGLAKLSY